MKRSSGGIGRSEKQKRTKSYHCSKNRYGGSSPFSIQQGMAGILVMCTRTKEARAAKEAIDLFNQYADQFYPETISLYQQKDEENDKNEEEEKDEGDLEASIAKELEGLKDTKNNKERFTNISTGTDCMLFIKTCPEIEPAQFVHDILTDMAEKQIKKTRCISRILPVQRTCSANIPEMERVSKLVIHPQFNTKDDDGNIVPKVFSVVARLRNCTKLDRLDVVKAFATSIGPDHKVDLANPDYVILVDITRVSY
ncbi:uncharacterized protein BX664DRAFT_258908 [Halteromyces radiatus]|uniref:uncharacterized protein n=1 Tax=Halteromyces radiatus TaxID=101107 RepID=UPI002220FE87|nr:uncharacterized protein BX664DRAFT_258908 [Halteromyces radiatus]KAI8096477.1 hypothetical protein BX664DRAFT_258908 [Halteromyces radiatus]